MSSWPLNNQDKLLDHVQNEVVHLSRQQSITLISTPGWTTSLVLSVVKFSIRKSVTSSSLPPKWLPTLQNSQVIPTCFLVLRHIWEFSIRCLITLYIFILLLFIASRFDGFEPVKMPSAHFSCHHVWPFEWLLSRSPTSPSGPLTFDRWHHQGVHFHSADVRWIYFGSV